MGFISLGFIGDAISAAEHAVSDLSHGNIAGAFGDVAGGIGKMISQADPLPKLLDIAGNALGLPDGLTNVLKVGVGIATGDEICAADGLLEGFDALSHAIPAHTDYAPPRTDGVCHCPGYARPPPGQAAHSVPPRIVDTAPVHRGPVSYRPPQYRPQVIQPPPSQVGSGAQSYLAEKAQAFQALENNFDKMPPMFRNMITLDREGLEKMANSPATSADLKRAARFLLEHDDAFDQVAKSGGKISSSDLQIGLQDTNSEIRDGGVGLAEAEGNTRPQLEDKLQAFQTLKSEFGQALGEDGVFGALDHKIDLDTLKDINNDADAPPELKSAARYVVEHPEAYAEIARSGDEVAVGDLQIAIDATQKKLGKLSGPTNSGIAPPSPPSGVSSSQPAGTQSTQSAGASSSSGASKSGLSAQDQGQLDALSNQINDILNDPTMSIEEKIMEILMVLQEKNDLEVKGQMNELSQVQNQQNSIDRTADDSQGKLDKNQQDMGRVQFGIQQLMDKRKQLSELMSNLEAAFNEMAKVAIQNVAR